MDTSTRLDPKSHNKNTRLLKPIEPLNAHVLIPSFIFIGVLILDRKSIPYAE